MQAEPTYATPRSPDRHSDGPQIGAAIARWLGRRPTRWQQETIDVALERLDGPGSPFAYDEVAVIVGRRCGKTVTTFGVPLGRALAGPVRLPNGRRMPFKATHTAQNLTQARERFNDDLVEPYKARFTEEQWDRAVDYKRAAAGTTLTIDPRAGKARKSVQDAVARRVAASLRVLAPTPNSARGAGVLHLTFDEALTFTRERGEQLRSAARPTMAEMHGLAQAWTVSNVALQTGPETYLWSVREKGRAAVAAGRRTGICYVEFSLPRGEDPADERNWWRYYPGLGDGIVGAGQLRRDLEELGIGSFAAEYLCRWPDENDLGLVGWAAITHDDWQGAGTDEQQPDDAPAGLGVDIDPFGRTATLVTATDRPGRHGTLVEVVDHRAGTGWVLDAVRDMAGHVQAIAVDDYGPGHELLEQLNADPTTAGKVAATKSMDFVAACFAFDADVRERRLSWRRSTYHEALTAAVAAAQRTSGKSWQWERRVAVSQSPLVAATLASWALGHGPAPATFYVY